MDLWSCSDGDVGATIDRFWSHWTNLHRGPLSPATVQTVAEAVSAENLKRDLYLQLKNWLRILDEVNGWLISLYIEMRHLIDADLAEEKTKSGLSAQFSAVCYILGRIVSDGQAMKVLILNGCEYQCRVLLRSTIEHLDLFTSMLENEELAEAFMSSGSEAASNAFWHKHISRGKLKKLPPALIRSSPDLGDWWAEFRQAEDEMHSIFSHPNIAAAIVLNLLSDEHLLDPQMVYVRKLSSGSIRSIRFFSLHVISIVWSNSDALISSNDRIRGSFDVLGVPIRKEFGELLHVGKNSLVGLFVFLIENINSTFLDLDLDGEPSSII